VSEYIAAPDWTLAIQLKIHLALPLPLLLLPLLLLLLPLVPADIFAASLLLASNILIDHWPQLMADLRAGRCFSWLPADGSEGNNSEGRGRRLPAPPADVAAAVDAVLTPSAELADELQKVSV
jgi:auxin responsive GH3 family protein